MRKKDLEILLQQLKEPIKPKLLLEQYTIPASLAAKILYLAFMKKDIEGRKVLDLGCGSGRLAIGAALLKAKIVVGVDKDREILKLARENKRMVENIIGKLPIVFVLADVENFFGNFDTVIQNPPFGIKKRSMDRIFLKKAIECGKRIYSLHRGGMRRTRKFLTNFIEKIGGIVESISEFKFTLPYTFPFHKKPRISFKVDLYIISSKNKYLTINS